MRGSEHAPLRGERGEQLLRRGVRVRQQPGVDAQLVHASASVSAISASTVAVSASAIASSSVAAATCSSSSVAPTTCAAIAVATSSGKAAAVLALRLPC